MNKRCYINVFTLVQTYSGHLYSKLVNHINSCCSFALFVFFSFNTSVIKNLCKGVDLIKLLIDNTHHSITLQNIGSLAERFKAADSKFADPEMGPWVQIP